MLWFSTSDAYAQEFLFSWGSEGSGDGEFNQPFGIAMDSKGNIYVADNFNNRIQKFDSSGSHLKTWGSKGTGEGQFLNVYGMAFDSSDNLYAIDGGSNDRIQKFTSEGDFVTLWDVRIPGDDLFLYPLDIAIDSQDKIYVLENANNRVQVFDTEGNSIEVWGSEGSGDGELQNPVAIAIDSSDMINILEFGNKRVQKFDESGSFIKKWGTYGTDRGEFYQPKGIDIDLMGNVYLTDSNKIQMFTGDGSFITYWGSFGFTNEVLKNPNHLLIDSSNNIYVADGGNNRISVYSEEILDSDEDFDGVPYNTDNCPIAPNEDQADSNEDGVGDVCEGDKDGDGVPDDVDKCPVEPVPIEYDFDADGCPDTMGMIPPLDQQGIPPKDSDEDGIPDYDDNCPTVPNSDQIDADRDYLGDACDNSIEFFDFSISSEPSSTNIQSGEHVAAVITLEKDGNDTGKVLLRCARDDVDCLFEPERLEPDGYSNLIVRTDNQTGVGQLAVTVLGEGGGELKHTSLFVDVEPIPNEKPVPIISPVKPAKVNKPVLFDATNSYDKDGEIKEYFWNFPGNNTAEGLQVTYTFETEGIHPVVLTVKDDDGERDSLKEEILVSPAFDPLLVIMLGIFIMVGALVGILIITRKRGEKKQKRINIPKPKDSKLR